MSARISKTPFTTAFFSGLLFEYKWIGEAITYSIPSGSAQFRSPYPEWQGWFSLSTQEAIRFRELANLVDSYIDLSFHEIPDTVTYGDIRVAYTSNLQTNSIGYAYLPTPRFLNGTEPNRAAGDIWLSPQLANTGVLPGQQLHHILMHELGHALGLTHPFEDNAPFPKVASRYDNFQYTVMSYSDHPYHINAFPVTFMPLDILALQYLYGTNFRHSPENTTYRFNNQINIQTIWDPGGYNTLDFSALNSSVRIDMREGSFSSAGSVSDMFNRSSPGVDNLALAYGTRIHELIGTRYSDHITGNRLDNLVFLGNGNDTYSYTGGNDRVYGGNGNNLLILSGSQKNWLYLSLDTEYDQLEYTGPKQGQFQFHEIIQFKQFQQVKFDDGLVRLDQLKPPKLTASLQDGAIPHLSPIILENKIISPEEAQLYRIYLGALGRIPDIDGFNWWMNQFQQSKTFDHLLIGFYVSDEFRSKSDTNRDGVISNAELLTHLYTNVLNREPDQEGYNWWMNSIINAGVQPQQVIFNFTQSDEYVYKTLNTVAEMLWI